jgi:hypothetical protein
MESSHSQTYVNEQVTATASNESGSRWWKDDGNLLAIQLPVHVKQIL